MKLSVVTTMYYSEPYLDEFYERIVKSIKKITDDYEIVFVNDGSPDDSLQKALSLREKDKNIKVLDLSRNFGHHKAIMTGLSHTNGDYVFLIDCDLEEDPELLEEFWDKMNDEDGIDVVFGVQERRKGKAFERFSGWAFYKIFNLLSDIKIEKNLLVIRIMKKKYVDALIRHREKVMMFVGLCELTGFNQKTIAVKKKSKSTTTYNFFKKINMAVNALVSLSSKPLYMIFYIGSIMSFFSFFIAVFFIFRKLFYGISISGWTSLVVSLWAISGVTIFSLGIIGIYLSKIFLEVKDRPYVIIKDKYSNDE